MVSQDRWSFMTGRINMNLQIAFQANDDFFVFLVRLPLPHYTGSTVFVNYFQVVSAHQEKLLNRQRRGPLPTHHDHLQRDKRYIVHNKGLTLGISNRDYEELERKHQEYYKNRQRDFAPSMMNFDDPMWPEQWYLVSSSHTLTHWGLVTPYGNIDMGTHWLR